MTRIIFPVFIVLTFFGGCAIFAQTHPEKGTINDEPLTWKVDIFDELKKTIPSIESRQVYYMSVANNVLFPNTVHMNYTSTSHSFELARGDKKGILQPKGHLAQPGDIVTLSYNQRLQLYVPYVEKIYILSAKRGGNFSAVPQELDSLATTYKHYVDENKQVDFSNTKKTSTKKIKGASTVKTDQ